VTVPTPAPPGLRLIPQFDHDNLPIADWQDYRKTTVTAMIRMLGPFTCHTQDNNYVTCQDGWLALDTVGHPYPIAAAEHDASYELAVEDDE